MAEPTPGARPQARGARIDPVRLAAVARKEWIQLRRDPRSLALAFALPVVLLMLFGAAITWDVRNISMAVVDQDRTAQSRSLIQAFTASGYFDLARRLERALAAALIAFYVGDLFMRREDGTFTLDHALPMQLCDWALLAVSAALWFRWRTCFEVAYFWGLAGTFQALFTPAIPEDLHWFRKFGFFFIHAGIVVGILHLLFNMFALSIFGPAVEGRYGRGRFLAMYFAAGFLGSAFSLAFTAGGIRAGASGGVFGVLGAWIAFFFRHRHRRLRRDWRRSGGTGCRRRGRLPGGGSP